MKRLLAAAIAASALAATPALAGTSVAVSVQNLDLEVGAGEASPLSLTVDLKHDLSSNVFVGGQLGFALDDDQGTEVSQLFGVDVGLKHQFSNAFGVYGAVGLGSAAVDTTGGSDGDGMSLRYGMGALLTVGRNGVLDIGWSSLYDDDMDFAGVDVPVTIAGPHVGLGLRF